MVYARFGDGDMLDPLAAEGGGLEKADLLFRKYYLLRGALPYVLSFVWKLVLIREMLLWVVLS